MRRRTSQRHGQSSLSFQAILALCLTAVLLLFGHRPQAVAAALNGGTTVLLTITTSGLTGTITNVSVTLTTLTTTDTNNLDMLLIHPNGSNNLLFMSDSTVNTATPYDNFSGTITLADDGATCLPNESVATLTPGTYRPADYGASNEALGNWTNLSTAHPALTITRAGGSGGSACATAKGTATFASAFGTLSPNGTWELWIDNDTGGAAENATLGRWSLSITTTTGSATVASVESFTATPFVQGGTQLAWRTGFEVDNLGFNVYRDDNGQRTKLNPSVIAGSALLVGPGTALTAGREYVWWDDAPPDTGDPRYWLEDIDLTGRSTWHGPAVTGRSLRPEQLPPAGRARTTLLSRLGEAAVSTPPTVPVERRVSPTTLRHAGALRQSRLAAQPAVKLSVRHEGWYRVTLPELLAAGLPPTVDPRNLQLYVDGQHVPILITGQEDGRFDPDDTLDFYGVGLDASWTDARVYWLVVQGGPGRRLRPVTAPGGSPADHSFPYTVERQDRTVYFSALRNGERENFFGAVVSSEPTTQALQLAHLDPAPAGATLLEVDLQGVTLGAHRVEVTLNGVNVGEVTFQDQAAGAQSFVLAPSSLLQGSNQVELVGAGGEWDISLIESIRLTYWRTYTADRDALRFSATGQQRVTISGFSGAAIRVVDITEADAVHEVIGVVKPQDGGYAVTLNVPGSGPRTLLAFTPAQAQAVADITPTQPSRWQRPGQGADLVIISHHDFIASLESLRALRQAQGLGVVVIDVADLYDEFSAGHKTPYAVRDFLNYAATQWDPVPRFVMLVGDASWDPKNYLGYGDHDFVPTKLIDTQLMETASDDWLADFDQDGLAEMAVGRLPGRTIKDIDRLVAKIVGYNQASGGGVLLVSDLDDGIDFGSTNEMLWELIPPTIPVEAIDRGQMTSETAKSQLIASLDRGPALVNYAGHGSVNLWRGNFLTSDDAAELNNGERLSLFVTMTCLNGYFHDAALESLAEALLHATGGGAVAVWAPSGMTGPISQAAMNQELFRWLFVESSSTGEPFRLGEVIRRAKAGVSDQDVQRTWILLGDPTLLVKLP